MAPRPFKLWRQPRGGAAEVVASGTVDDNDGLTVTDIVAPFKLPAERITLPELETTATRASIGGARVWVDVEAQE
jgi:hypothetical protein